MDLTPLIPENRKQPRIDYRFSAGSHPRTISQEFERRAGQALSRLLIAGSREDQHGRRDVLPVALDLRILLVE